MVACFQNSFRKCGSRTTSRDADKAVDSRHEGTVMVARQDGQEISKYERHFLTHSRGCSPERRVERSGRVIKQPLKTV